MLREGDEGEKRMWSVRGTKAGRSSVAGFQAEMGVIDEEEGVVSPRTTTQGNQGKTERQDG